YERSFHSNFNNKARGTAILIHKKVLFTPSQTISDPQGRYVIVSGSLFSTPVILASVYAPNWDDVIGLIFFLIDKTLLPSIKKTEYTTIVESDHAPVSLDISFSQNVTQPRVWRLDTSLLSDNHFCEFIGKAIDEFIHFNRSDSISPCTLWETL
uniref:Endonuclease/exonuclease/phosphatase domain-containing protein n=1 Tax=Pygocentrus nattereri TaxID=42514 RepID=A0AAR2LD98_PYGNA